MTTKDVTVVLVDGGNNSLQSARTINHCAGLMDWGAVHLFCYEKPTIAVNGKVFLIRKLEFPIGRSNFMGHLGPCLFHTPFMLYVETDGFPINPHLWKDSWLEYDLVGPPWSVGWLQNVAHAYPDFNCVPRIGSGGCCLRSRRMAELTAEAGLNRNGINAGLDFFDSIMMRAEFERKGIKYASAEVGIEFCYQLPVEGFPDWTDSKSFSFHCIDRLGAPAGRKYA